MTKSENIVKSFPLDLAKIHEMERGVAGSITSMPSRTGAVDFLKGLIALLFPLTRGLIFSRDEIEYRWLDLQLQFRRLITPVLPCGTRRSDVTQSLFERIPDIYNDLRDDAVMFNECDPAAWCKEEVILSYPGFYAIMVHRFAHEIHKLGIPILPRVLSEYAHSGTGIDIHPGATIGKHFYIDHGTGAVIGETCVIGERVKMYQGVTLGATFVNKEMEGTKRHPTIENGVILYAGCTILGGDTVIGHDSVIGGNVWLTESVPPYSKVYHKPDIVIKEAVRG